MRNRETREANIIMFSVKMALVLSVLMYTFTQCGAQVVSKNGEFSYEFVAKNTLVTSLGDTIYTGHNYPVYMSNEGHPYNLIRFEGQYIKILFSGPWYSHNTIFVEYYNTGEVKQFLLLYTDEKKIGYFYYCRFGEERGSVKHNKFAKVLSLWQ
jgi:hypothetical protein